MKEQVDQKGLEILFKKAHTHSQFQEKEVPQELLKAAYDLAKMGPTSANCQPMRIVFLTSKDAKERLKEALSPGNVEKTMKAPVVAILAYDQEFYLKLPRLYPHADAKSWFEEKPKFAAITAFRNGTLQGAYFLVACRALGLDCGPMSGFNNKKVDELFFQNTPLCSNFLMNIGYADPEEKRERDERLSFEEACTIL